MKDRVYPIKCGTGAGVGKAKVRWYAINAAAPREELPAGLTADTGITADDLAWMAHYRQKFNQRQESRRV